LDFVEKENIGMAHWADQIISNMRTDKIVINDSKTLSGSAHVGSLRGPVIHDVLYRAAKDAGKHAEFSYGSDDFDALDSVPPYLSKEKYQEYLGKPICNVPAPDNNFANYSDFYLHELLGVIQELGIKPRIYRLSNLYRTGVMNSLIERALDKADTIREIYYAVNQSEKETEWLPFQVICEQCGKIATTRILKYDGKLIQYTCRTESNGYTTGCGYSGAVSPYNGTGKLPWKIEWAARWSLYGINLEGAGIDHSVAGGSRDVANAISVKVFDREPPENCRYEFFLLGKRKMSSSKGIGSTARQVANIIPPEQLRYLLVRTKPKSTIDFRLDEMAIPTLFNHYDKAADNYVTQPQDDDENLRRTFELSALDPDFITPPKYLPSFSHVTTLLQIPGTDLLNHFEKHKGSALSEVEIDALQKRINCAKVWLNELAPDTAIFEIQSDIPKSAWDLSDKQRSFLSTLASFLRDNENLNGEKIHKKAYDIASDIAIDTKDGFEAIYITLLDRLRGPRAGELISALDKDFVIRRFEQAGLLQNEKNS